MRPSIGFSRLYIMRHGNFLERRLYEVRAATSPRSDVPGPQDGVRRPWWRRMFGG